MMIALLAVTTASLTGCIFEDRDFGHERGHDRYGYDRR
jgi:hypothetical protein